MNLESARDQVRRTLQDVREPFLWDDEELDLYINEAALEAVTRAKLLRKDKPITLKADKAEYPLGDEFYEIHSVLDSDDELLTEYSEEDLGLINPAWREKKGDPDGYVIQGQTLRIVDIPDKEYKITVRMYVFPEELSGNTDLPGHYRHHFRMLDWALYLAYTKRDAETANDQLARYYEARFEASFGKRRDANVQRKHAEKRRHQVVYNAL